MNRDKKIPDNLKDMAHKVKSKTIKEKSFLGLLMAAPSMKKEQIMMVNAFTAKS
jgi:hypothetical protein